MPTRDRLERNVSLQRLRKITSTQRHTADWQRYFECDADTDATEILRIVRPNNKRLTASLIAVETPTDLACATRKKIFARRSLANDQYALGT
jgi:hypothetical protein